MNLVKFFIFSIPELLQSYVLILLVILGIICSIYSLSLLFLISSIVCLIYNIFISTTYYVLQFEFSDPIKLPFTWLSLFCIYCNEKTTFYILNKRILLYHNSYNSLYYKGKYYDGYNGSEKIEDIIKYIRSVQRKKWSDNIYNIDINK